jgi:hypothetical protein
MIKAVVITDAFEAEQPLTGIDANFYTHELTESSLMDSGLDWQIAHAHPLSTKSGQRQPVEQSRQLHGHVMNPWEGRRVAGPFFQSN